MRIGTGEPVFWLDPPDGDGTTGALRTSEIFCDPLASGTGVTLADDLLLHRNLSRPVDVPADQD